MKALLILLLAIAGLFNMGFAHAETLDDANRAFAGGQYHASTQGYQAILTQNGYSAPVLFDLGNSYYREGNFAQAILSYQRARLLAPNDADIAANLQLAQRQAGVAVSDPQWSDKLTTFLSASVWAWLACSAWTLFCLCLLVRAVIPQWRSPFMLIAIADALVLGLAIAALVVSSSQLRQAVVIDKNASALISPFPAAQTVFAPAPGETVTVQKAYDDFFLVKDNAGHSGWISKTQITPIVPPGAS